MKIETTRQVKITIGIPVYNGEKFLQRCFATLDAQKYHNLELIFVNNNSTDHSEKMIEQYLNLEKFSVKRTGI